VAAWIDIELGTANRHVRYATTADGWASTAQSGLLTEVVCSGTPTKSLDPMSAASPSSDVLLVGSVSGTASTSRGAALTIYPVTDTMTLGTGLAVECIAEVDKAAMDIGPRHDSSTDEAVYLCHTIIDPDHELFSRRSDDSAGAVWSSPHHAISPTGSAPGADGHGAVPVVIGGTGTNRGRVVIVYQQQPGASTMQAAVRFSEDGGSSWPDNVTELNLVGTTSIQIDGYFPAIAADPVNHNTLYVVFSALVQGNRDLFVFKSTDAGETFSANNRFRLTDSQLGEPSGAHQFFGAAAVDQYGGLNILYYVDTSSGHDLSELQPKYARFNDLAASPRSWALTDPFDARDPVTKNVPTIGDYHTIVAAGCLVHMCYMGGDENETHKIFASVFDICIADVAADGLIDVGDVTAFVAAFGAGDPRADVNRDGFIDAQDITDFNTAYACGCGTPP
jgi:hypothetical protein